MERILVTGGTGFTGAHLVRSLRADGHAVAVVSRSAERARRVLPRGVAVIEGDLARRGTARRAVRGRDAVFHLATVFREPGIPDQRYHDVHVGGTRFLLEAARDEGVRRFVHCSTVGVHGHIEDPPADESTPHRPGDIYQVTKSEAETLALAFHRRHGLPLSVARPTAIYGPGDLRLLKLFRMIARGRFAMVGDGTPYYHMVHVTDLVRGLRLLGEHPAAVGQVYILGGEEYRSLNELVALIADAVGRPTPRLCVPARPLQLAGSVCEKVCIPFGIEPPIFRRRVDFFTKSRAFSIEKAKRDLGYRPDVPLESGIVQTAEWYRTNGHL